MVWGAGAGRPPVCRSFRAPAIASKECRRQIPRWTTCEHPFWVRIHSGPVPRANDERWLSNLVEEFFSGLANALHAVDVPYRQIGMGDVPALCRDLMIGDKVFHLRVVDARPAFPARKEDIHFVG